MNRFTILVAGSVLTSWARALSADDFSIASLDGLALSVAVLLALFGMMIGIFAGRQRGFNLFGAALGGFFLGPFAFLLFFMPGLDPRTENWVKCPFCAGLIRPNAAVCGHCHRHLDTAPDLSEPTPTPPIQRSKSNPKTEPTAPVGVSTEFAQYSEMARRTIPGAFIRPAIPDDTAKAAKEKVIRCVNPDCNRILPPPYHTCPHCGTTRD